MRITAVTMLSSVLSRERAIAVNLAIVRAFVRLRQRLAPHAELAYEQEKLEHKYDGQFRIAFAAIRQSLAPLIPPAPCWANRRKPA